MRLALAGGTSFDIFSAGVFAGVDVAVLVGYLLALWLLFGGYSYVVGDTGEKSTCEAVARLRKSGVIYGWVGNIELDSGDIDHLVITRAGALVLETKFATTALRSGQIHQGEGQLNFSQRKARSVLRSAHVPDGRRVPVRATAVVWGRVPSLRSVTRRSEAAVIHGDHLEQFVEELPDCALTPHQTQAPIDDLREFAETHRAPDAV